MKGKPNVSRRAGWKLFPLMAQNNIRTAAELCRRINALGVEVSSIYLSRMLNERPARLNTDLLDAFINILNCTPNDLLPVTEVSDYEESGQPVPAEKMKAGEARLELAATNVVKFEKKEDGKKKKIRKRTDVPEDILGPDTFVLPTEKGED